MESLLIIYKLIVWGYAAFDYISSKQRTGSGFVLVSLIYFCLQLFALIVRHMSWKTGSGVWFRCSSRSSRRLCGAAMGVVAASQWV